MLTNYGVAWKQLSHSPVKLAVAAAGVVVAVMLMLVQLGIRRGALDSSVAVARRFTSDLVVISPRTETIFDPASFPRRLLHRMPADPAVIEVQELMIAKGRFRDPWDHIETPITIYGIDPRAPLVDFPGLPDLADRLTLADRVVFDGMSRGSFGPVAQTVREKGSLWTEVNRRRIELVGVVEVGISFSSDGNLYTTPANFLRLLPERKPSSVDVGLVRLAAGSDATAARERLARLVGREGSVFTRQELVDREVRYIRETHPLDFIFGLGTTVGFFIGFVVVYQILYTEVSNHLPHYATMKAMGFADGYLMRLVLGQAATLSVLGYAPGLVLAMGVYQIAKAAIRLPFEMTLSRAVGVFCLTAVMCAVSGLVAMQKIRSADPADVF